ncbi:MAG: hypothetical protein KF721_07225 [Ignavibacteriaceae bacterium]|nr:hypothetical protein [Ignavibacteriaceae bacterium]
MFGVNHKSQTNTFHHTQSRTFLAVVYTLAGVFFRFDDFPVLRYIIETNTFLLTGTWNINKLKIILQLVELKYYRG